MAQPTELVPPAAKLLPAQGPVPPAMRRIFVLEDLEPAARRKLPRRIFGYAAGATIGLGASFVFVGRPFNYAAALAGEPGVDHAIDLLRTQLQADLGMLGLLNMTEMGRDLLLLRRFDAI